MKKIVYLLLAAAIALNCFASCNATPDQNTTGSEHTGSVVSESNEFVSPDDEARAVHTVSAENKDGLKMEITVHGYRSESLNREFYVKSNEYFLVDVKVTNTSEKPLWQWLPTYCRNGGGIPHNHEIGFDISCKDLDECCLSCSVRSYDTYALSDFDSSGFDCELEFSEVFLELLEFNE